MQRITLRDPRLPRLAAPKARSACIVIAGTTGGEQDSARDGSVIAAEDDLGSSKSEMSDIDVRSRQERESRGFLRGVRARVRSAFGDG